MMKRSLVCLGVLYLTITIILFSCKTTKEDEKRYCYFPPQPIIEIRDSQERDLLDPATPGHLDTLKIKQLNSGQVKVIPPNPYTIGNKDRIRLGILASSYQLRITNDVSAEIIIKTEPWECTSKITYFSFNGVVYTPSFNNYFIVKQ
jgi:hypothetical protein